MHGFGHDKGHKVFTWSHDSRDQSWVAQNTRRERVGPPRHRSRGHPQLRFGGLGLKLEKEGPKRPRQWTAKLEASDWGGGAYKQPAVGTE